MARGTVKWFDDQKGFGMIGDDDHEDLFVHYSAIASDGYRTLHSGQRVEFDVVSDSFVGARAINVRILSTLAKAPG
jgi:CspA family cold shock protein